MDKYDRLEVMMESQSEKIDLLVEGFSTFKDVPKRLDSIDQRLEHLESDMRVVKGVIRDHSADIAENSAAIATLGTDTHG